jgi:chorismate synthase
MAGSSIGIIFKVTTWGESHGTALGAVVDGCPPTIELTTADIQTELDRRRPGQSAIASARQEGDSVEILSGTFEGRTTGTPIALIVTNKDVDSAAYDALKNVFRPGHGDLTYARKYGIRDHRGGGRASARETVARVAAGAIAKKVIARAGIEVIGYTQELGGIPIEQVSFAEIGNNDLFCPDANAVRRMEARLEEARAQGDSLGGIVAILVKGCPAGLGEPVFDKMDADLAKALMGIGTVKGVEIGAGFKAAGMTGSENNDPITSQGFATNHAGGILAGITNGDEIVIRVACKPIPSIEKTQETIDNKGKPKKIAIHGRHDVAVIPRIIPVCEAMVAIVLADHLMRQKALNNFKGG